MRKGVGLERGLQPKNGIGKKRGRSKVYAVIVTLHHLWIIFRLAQRRALSGRVPLLIDIVQVWEYPQDSYLMGHVLPKAWPR